MILWGSYLNGFLCGLFAYLYLRCKSCSGIESCKADEQSRTLRTTRTGSTPRASTLALLTLALLMSRPLILFSFFIGMQCSFTVGSAIVSGVWEVDAGLMGRTRACRPSSSDSERTRCEWNGQLIPGQADGAGCSESAARDCSSSSVSSTPAWCRVSRTNKPLFPS